MVGLTILAMDSSYSFTARDNFDMEYQVTFVEWDPDNIFVMETTFSLSRDPFTKEVLYCQVQKAIFKLQAKLTYERDFQCLLTFKTAFYFTSAFASILAAYFLTTSALILK